MERKKKENKRPSVNVYLLGQSKCKLPPWILQHRWSGDYLTLPLPSWRHSLFNTKHHTEAKKNTQILIKVFQLVFSEYITAQTTRASVTCHREKNFRKACGGIGTCSELLSTFSSFSWNSGSWSAIQGCPIDFQNRQRQLRHSWIISAYSSRRPNDLRITAFFRTESVYSCVQLSYLNLKLPSEPLKQFYETQSTSQPRSYHLHGLNVRSALSSTCVICFHNIKVRGNQPEWKTMEGTSKYKTKFGRRLHSLQNEKCTMYHK